MMLAFPSTSDIRLGKKSPSVLERLITVNGPYFPEKIFEISLAAQSINGEKFTYKANYNVAITINI